MEYHMDEWPEELARTAPVPAGGRQRELVQEGRHLFEIVRAGEKGVVLELAFSRVVDGDLDRDSGWVWCNLPRDKDWARRIVASLAAALELSPAAWNVTKVADLEGRQVEAEVYHKQLDTRVVVNVRHFYRIAPATPATPAPARRPAAAKALAADDIPF